MIWFLRLFPAYRALESQVQPNGEALIHAHDRERTSEAIIGELRTQLAASREELIEILKNRPVPAAPLGAQQVIRGTRIQGRDLVAQKTAEFLEEEAVREQAS